MQWKNHYPGERQVAMRIGKKYLLRIVRGGEGRRDEVVYVEATYVKSDTRTRYWPDSRGFLPDVDYDLSMEVAVGNAAVTYYNEDLNASLLGEGIRASVTVGISLPFRRAWKYVSALKEYGATDRKHWEAVQESMAEKGIYI